MRVSKLKKGVQVRIECADDNERERIYTALSILREPLRLLIAKTANMIEFIGLSAIEEGEKMSEMRIGSCPNGCAVGNRPGPWHQKSCSIYMSEENAWHELRKAPATL